MKKIILFISLLTITIANSWAERSESEDTYKLFESQIFSLSKKKERSFDAASSVFVLGSEDIRRSGATSIPEVLRLVPGIQVARIDGHKWAISSRGFNEQFSNKLLIMIDGRTIYTPLFSGAFWDVQDYPLADIAKIEVIRGSGGAIWGANAVNGIINIITKNSINTQGFYASSTVGQGDGDKVITEVRYGGKTNNKNHYRLYAKERQGRSFHKLNSNDDNDDGYKESQAGFRYDIGLESKNQLSLSGEIRNGKANNYFDFTPYGTNSTNPAHKNSKGGNLLANWQKTISAKSSMTLQTYLDYDQFDNPILKRAGRTADIDFQHFYSFNNSNQLTWGLGYRLLQDSIKEYPLNNTYIPLEYTPDKKTDQIFSAFLQDKISLIADKLYLTIGSKFEHNEFTGQEYQPSAKLALYPAHNQTAWASISRAVRTPTRGDDGIVINNPATGTPLQSGNRQYGAERVIAYEVGYRIKPNFRSLIDVALFYNDYNQLRTFDVNGTANNKGKGESFGGEITAKWKVNKKWKLEAGYDFLKIDLKTRHGFADSEIFSIKDIEKKSPKNQFRLRSNYNITSKIEFDNIAYYVDSLPTSNIPSYIRLDSRIGYLFNSHLDFSLGVQNITDHRHQEFTGGTFANQIEIGRTIYLKTVLHF